MQQPLSLKKSQPFKIHSLWRRYGKLNDSPIPSTTLRIQVPSSMELGKPISLMLEMVHDGQGSNAPLVPGLHLLSVKHDIEARTYVRVPGIAKDEDSGITKFLVGDFVEWKNKKLRFKEKNNERILRPGETLDLAKELCFIILELQQPSTFKSYGISRVYSSKTTVKVECGGLKQKAVFKIEDFKVLPAKGYGPSSSQSLIAEK